MSGTSAKILIVDDNPGDVRIAGRALRRSGEHRFVLRHARTAGEAEATLDSAVVDLVVLDLGLPDSQGVGTVARLLPRTAGVPVIVLTGAEQDDSLGMRCLDAGADDFLPKARIAGDLNRIVEFALRRRTLLSRRLAGLGEKLLEQAGPWPPLGARTRELLGTQLDEVERGLMMPDQRDESARRIRSLARRLVDANAPPCELLARLAGEPQRLQGPAAAVLLMVAAELGQAYFERARGAAQTAEPSDASNAAEVPHE